LAVDTEYVVEIESSVVQTWFNADRNFGMILWFKPADGNGVCFFTSEAADPQKRPELVVTLLP
jgi:hypothetical protein